MIEAVNEYWDEFIVAMRETTLGDCKDSDVELAAAWIGWQAAKRFAAPLSSMCCSYCTKGLNRGECVCPHCSQSTSGAKA